MDMAMDDVRGIAIGALATRANTTVETIRFYERIGLLPAPARTAAGYRIYGLEHARRLNFVRRARSLGFSIEQIRQLFRLADERQRPCGEVSAVAKTHLQDVRAKIADLKAMARVLEATVARCGRGGSSHCPVIDALYDGGRNCAMHMARASMRRHM